MDVASGLRLQHALFKKILNIVNLYDKTTLNTRVFKAKWLEN